MSLILIAKIVQIAVAILLTFLVLIQAKGAGLSYGIKSSFSMYRSLRGVEKTVFILTIVMGVVLVLNSMAILYLS